MTSTQRYRATILNTGKATMGFEVPPAVVDALGSGRRSALGGGRSR